MNMPIEDGHSPLPPLSLNELDGGTIFAAVLLSWNSACRVTVLAG
jgi:hypothetical protein